MDAPQSNIRASAGRAPSVSFMSTSSRRVQSTSQGVYAAVLIATSKMRKSPTAISNAEAIRGLARSADWLARSARDGRKGPCCGGGIGWGLGRRSPRSPRSMSVRCETNLATTAMKRSGPPTATRTTLAISAASEVGDLMVMAIATTHTRTGITSRRTVRSIRISAADNPGGAFRGRPMLCYRPITGPSAVRGARCE